MKLSSETIKSVVESNETAKGIFELFHSRKRLQRSTNLQLMRRNMVGYGLKVVDDDFLNTFKKLEETGVGSLSKRGDRFQWFYNLKDVAGLALGDTHLPPRQIELEVSKASIKTTKRAPGRPKKRGPGRPKGSKSVPRIVPLKTDKNGAYIQIRISSAMLKQIKGM